MLWDYNEKENGSYYGILGLYRDTGKENGSYYSILGLYRDNGKENGNYYSILGLCWDNGKLNGSYYLGFRSRFVILTFLRATPQFYNLSST